MNKVKLWGSLMRKGLGSSFQAETFAKLNLKQKSVRYRVGILAHRQTAGLITI